MRETRFIGQNKKNWEEFESLLDKGAKDPGKVSDLFVQITDDLAYARTHYPNRAIRVYLNNLARKVFRAVYSKKKNENIFKGFLDFFKEDAPALVWKARYEMLTCLVVFLLSFAAGMLSSRHDPEFPTYILGPEYVSMTEKNIQAGDPMAVYKQEHEATMFMGISYNNIFVSFRVYVFGILFGIGSLALLIYNGIMVGTFQYFFIPRGVFVESFATIWLHGVPEIFAIIFSSGAGLRLARGLVFPDTYSRLQSFQNSAWESLRLMICIIPVFIFAAFIEGFVTRYTELPVAVRLVFIALNAILIISYFVIYPFMKNRKGTLLVIRDIKVFSTADFSYREGSILSVSEIIKGSLSFLGSNLKWILRTAVVCATLVSAYFYIFPDNVNGFRITDEVAFMVFQKMHLVSDYSDPMMFVFNCIVFTIITLFSIRFARKKFSLDVSPLSAKEVIACFISVTLFNAVFFIDSFAGKFFLWALTFPMLIIFNFYISERKPVSDAIQNTFSIPLAGIVRYVGSAIMLYLLYFLFTSLVNSPLILFYREVVSWNLSSTALDKSGITFNYFCNLLASYVFGPFMIAGCILLTVSLEEIRTANNLISRINKIKGK